MKINKHAVRAEFRAEDGDTLTVDYDNRGDPYREGVAFHMSCNDRYEAHLFLGDREAVELRDLLLKLYPVTK